MYLYAIDPKLFVALTKIYTENYITPKKLIKNIFGISFSIKSNYIFSSTRSYKSSSLKLFIFINNHINIKLNIRRRNNSSLLIIINNEMFMFNINFNLFAIKILINIEELVDIERVDNKSSFHHK